jgi:hypothetical protein
MKEEDFNQEPEDKVQEADSLKVKTDVKAGGDQPAGIVPQEDPIIVGGG